MVSREFKIVLIVFAVVAVICGVVYLSTGNAATSDDKKTVVENEKIKNDIPDGIKLSKEDVDILNGSLNFTVTVKNTKAKEIKLKEVNLIIQNADGKTISDLLVPINTTLKKNEDIQLFAQDVVTVNGKSKKVIYRFVTE